MAKHHIVIEAHLEVDETIINPYNVGINAAKKINDLLEETYKRKVEKERQVRTLVVSHRVMSIAPTTE